jgi:primary-amine oxidase
MMFCVCVVFDDVRVCFRTRLAVSSLCRAGNAFRVTETPLLSVHQAMRMAKPEAGRAWKIKNPAVVNPITGQPVSFKLIPQTSECLLSCASCKFSR